LKLMKKDSLLTYNENIEDNDSAFKVSEEKFKNANYRVKPF
jgi:hypothetical protein